MKQTFEEFYYKTLLETPMNTGVFESEYSDTPIAIAKYTEILENPEQFKHVFTLFKEHFVYLYEERDENDITVYFVPKNDRFIYGYCSYEELGDGGIIMGAVYNRPQYVGLARKVYDDYLIPKYKYVLSNGIHSLLGKAFWKKLVLSNIKTNLIEIVNLETGQPILKIGNASQLDEYYGDDVDYEKFRIKITKNA